MRNSCIDCVRKHLAQASVLLDEVHTWGIRTTAGWLLATWLRLSPRPSGSSLTWQ
jgi:hypothetical protein